MTQQRRRRGRPGAVKQPTTSDLRGREKHRLKVAGVGTVNKSYPLPAHARSYYNQGATTECVAFSSSQHQTLMNGGELYHPGWLFWRAQEIDGIPGEAGTTTDAACRILRELGHVGMDPSTVWAPTEDATATPDPADGIDGFAWLSRTPDPALEQIRAVLATGPAIMVSRWYSGFGLNSYSGASWVEPQGSWGNGDGMWHQYLIDGAFDDGEYLTTPNSWGWPISGRMSYAAFKRLTNEGAYCVSFVDRGGAPVPVPPDPEPSFVCKRCGKAFISREKRKRHMKRRHR